MRLNRSPRSRAKASEDRGCRAPVSSTVQYHEFSEGGRGGREQRVPGTSNKRSPMVGCRPLMIEVRTCVQLNVNYDKLKSVIPLPPLFLQNVLPKIFSGPNVEQIPTTYLEYQKRYLAASHSFKRTGHKFRGAFAIFKGIRKFPIAVYQVRRSTFS